MCTTYEMNWPRSRKPQQCSAGAILMRIFMKLKLMKMRLRGLFKSLCQTYKQLFVFMHRACCLHSLYSPLWHCDCAADSDGCTLVSSGGCLWETHVGASWKPFKGGCEPICPSESLRPICERRIDGWRGESEFLYIFSEDMGKVWLSAVRQID